MSGYRVIWPDDATSDESVATLAAEPVILQFRVDGPHMGGPSMNMIERARVLFQNRSCKSCGYPVVTPIELNDAQLNRNQRPIPGTATLVGFHCHGCDAEWSV